MSPPSESRDTHPHKRSPHRANGEGLGNPQPQHMKGPAMNDTDSDTRAAYISGLRQLADILEQNTEIPAPIAHGDIQWLLFSDEDHDEQRALAVAIARAMPGTTRKWPTGDLFRVGGEIGALHWEVVVDRPAVCERVVTSTETVTRTVPDPNALAEVPTVEVTETIEHIEWVCGPLLAPTEAAA